jgi:hypothetical protein
MSIDKQIGIIYDKLNLMQSNINYLATIVSATGSGFTITEEASGSTSRSVLALNTSNDAYSMSNVAVRGDGNLYVGTTTPLLNEKLRIHGEVPANTPAITLTSTCGPAIYIPNGGTQNIWNFANPIYRTIYYEIFTSSTILFPNVGTYANCNATACTMTMAISPVNVASNNPPSTITKTMSQVNGTGVTLSIINVDGTYRLRVANVSGINIYLSLFVRQIFEDTPHV